jgi:monothiol glutaredoxin
MASHEADTPSKGTAMSAINDQIQSAIDQNDVMLFMKGTPNLPQCGFSGQLVQILNYLGVKFGSMNCLESDEVRQGIKTFSQWPTIPQLYVKGEFIGGCDIVREMFQAGELTGLFDAKGIAYKVPARA